MLSRLNAEWREIRNPSGLSGIDALIIPGGESTVMGRYLAEYGLIQPIRRFAEAGGAVWGICAGAILLCEEADEKPGVLRLLPASAERNAYGRQLSSFEEDIDTPVGSFHGVFIRAPRLRAGEGTEVLARRQGPGGSEDLLIRRGKILASSFHPELTGDDRIHRWFLDLAF